MWKIVFSWLLRNFDKKTNTLLNSKTMNANTDKAKRSLMHEVMLRMFFWCGIMLFDYRLKKYGGFNHFIAGKIFRGKLSYLELSITYKIRFGYKKFYYDGYHTCFHFLCVRLMYGA